jgi:hypothetical protein
VAQAAAVTAVARMAVKKNPFAGFDRVFLLWGVGALKRL